MLSDRENWLRAVTFGHPEWIPCKMTLAPLTWKVFREDLERIVLAHPRLFPEHREGSVDYDEMPPVYREGELYRDNWGCVWRNIQDGMEGQVVESPLADWRALSSYRMPDPATSTERGDRDWGDVAREVRERKAQGLLVTGNCERLFDRLYFLRGFDNLMMDFAADDPHLPELIEMLTEYELQLVDMWLELDADFMRFHTDIGTQRSLMISPAKFRRYIKPMFSAIFQTCRRAGKPVYLSSDGHLLEIVDDLIECGVSVHTPQLRANTLDGIAKAYKGRMCADLDLDRQSFPFLSPRELRAQVKEVVDRMAAPEGGLMIWAAISTDDVPLRSIGALCEAMEDYCLN